VDDNGIGSPTGSVPRQGGRSEEEDEEEEEDEDEDDNDTMVDDISVCLSSIVLLFDADGDRVCRAIIEGEGAGPNGGEEFGSLSKVTPVKAAVLNDRRYSVITSAVYLSIGAEDISPLR